MEGVFGMKGAESGEKGAESGGKGAESGLTGKWAELVCALGGYLGCACR